MASGSFVFINSNKVDMTSRSTNEVKSAERSLNVFLHFSLRGASPWSFSVELRGHFRSISHFHSSESESDRGR